jgi:phosphoserine phosphatase
MSKAAFATVILDVDSTVSGIEGVDWLAARRGEAVARQVAALTERAMRGEIALEDVYGARMALVRPDREGIDALANEYVAHIAPGCVEAVTQMLSVGVDVKLVSGGLRPAIVPLAHHLGLTPQDLSAVDVRLDSHGGYVSFDSLSPLTTARGKQPVVEAMSVRRPAVAVGDASTDLAMRPAVDSFVCFTGFRYRDAVVQRADAVVATFGELLRIVLPE